jgi:hypothetical protein
MTLAAGSRVGPYETLAVRTSDAPITYVVNGRQFVVVAVGGGADMPPSGSR